MLILFHTYMQFHNCETNWLINTVNSASPHAFTHYTICIQIVCSTSAGETSENHLLS